MDAKQRSMTVCCLAVVFLGLALPAHGYPGGAPTWGDMCTAMSPSSGHGGSPQGSISPFTISMGTTVDYKAGQPITVSIVAPGTRTLKGFMMQARSLDGTTQGTFSLLPTYDNVHPLQCGHADDTLTQSSKNKVSHIYVHWNPPSQDQGPIQFVATVLEKKRTYWENVKSAQLLMATTTTSTTTTTTTPTTTTTTPTTTTTIPTTTTTNPTTTTTTFTTTTTEPTTTTTTPTTTPTTTTVPTTTTTEPTTTTTEVYIEESSDEDSYEEGNDDYNYDSDDDDSNDDSDDSNDDSDNSNDDSDDSNDDSDDSNDDSDESDKSDESNESNYQMWWNSNDSDESDSNESR